MGDAATVAMAALARAAYIDEDRAAATTWARRTLEHHRRRHGPAASYDLVASTLVRVALSEGNLAGARPWTDERERGPDPMLYGGPLTAAAEETDADACRAEVDSASADVVAATSAVRSALACARLAELLVAGLAALVTVARILECRGDRDGARRLAAFLHGYQLGFSWEHASSRNRYRYDHVLASRDFGPHSCDDLHEFRLNGNHHAAVQAQQAWA